MKKSIAAIAIACCAGLAVAGSASYSGTNVGGDLWDRPVGAGPSISGLGPVAYSVQAFTVSASGAYDLTSVQDYDGYIHLYANSFDAGDQLANLLAGNDDGAGGIGTSDLLGRTLNAGTTYFLVTSGFAAGDEGTFTNTISGIGDVTIIPAPGALALVGLGGLAAARRRRA
jgi:hypothetical protein